VADRRSRALIERRSQSRCHPASASGAPRGVLARPPRPAARGSSPSAATPGLPPDAVNAWIPYPEGGGAEADFLWRGPRLIVEVGGRDIHTTRRAFEHDRRRDQRLATLGYRVIRFTWRQVMFEPAEVAATLTALL
jgi:hypothetical protein